MMMTAFGQFGDANDCGLNSCGSLKTSSTDSVSRRR